MFLYVLRIILEILIHCVLKGIIYNISCAGTSRRSTRSTAAASKSEMAKGKVYHAVFQLKTPALVEYALRESFQNVNPFYWLYYRSHRKEQENAIRSKIGKWHGEV